MRREPPGNPGRISCAQTVSKLKGPEVETDNFGPERLGNWSKVTQLIRSRARVFRLRVCTNDQTSVSLNTSAHNKNYILERVSLYMDLGIDAYVDIHRSRLMYLSIYYLQTRIPMPIN